MSNVQDEYRASHYYMSSMLQTEVNTHPLNSHSMLCYSAPLQPSVQTAAPGQIYRTQQTITNRVIRPCAAQ